jgi:hypothetical protein
MTVRGVPADNPRPIVTICWNAGRQQPEPGPTIEWNSLAAKPGATPTPRNHCGPAHRQAPVTRPHRWLRAQQRSVPAD